MKRLWIDIETRSRVDLKLYGAYRYAACPDFKILMASWTDDPDPEAPVHTAISEEEIWEIPGLWDPKVLKVAHNAPFERICFSTFAGLGDGVYIDPATYRDTMAIAAELGYPKSLGKLAKSLRAGPKDEAGTTHITLLSKPR